MNLLKKNNKVLNSLFLIYLVKTSRLLFKISVLTFIIYFSLEQFKTGLISNYFDLNILLILAIISGLFLLLFSEGKKHSKGSKLNYVILVIFAILLGVFLFQQLSNLGLIAMLISVISLISFLVIVSINLSKYE